MNFAGGGDLNGG